MSGGGDPEVRAAEAVAQSELGTLLQKQRAERTQAQVAEVLQRDVPTADKVREIRRVDAMAELEEQGETVAQPLVRPLAAIKSVIKTPHRRASYFEFLMRQHGRISAFARRSHTLQTSLLPPGVRLDPAVQKPFREQLAPLAADLLKLCDAALEIGWTVLVRADYNLVVLLKRLCFEVTSVNFRVLDYRDRDLVDSLRSLETYFFVLHYRGDYVERATRALQASLAAAGMTGERERAALLVETLLKPDLALPSLHDFLIGLNICKARRMLRLEDLVFAELGEIVNARDFACPPSVHMRIGDHVQSLHKQAAALALQKKEAERLKRVLPLDSVGNPDFAPIAAFYDAAAAAGDGPRTTFAVDRNNLMALAPRLFAAFDAALTPLLSGRVRLSDGPLVALFPPSVFGASLQRLRQTAGNLAQLGFSLHTLSRQRLLALKSTGKGAVAAETETMHQIDEGVRVLMEIASQIEGILESPLRRGDQQAVESAGPLAQPDREFSLPGRDQCIVSRDGLNGRPVAEALRLLVTLCTATGAFFLDRPIMLTLERAGKIDEKLEQTRRELERLAEPEAHSQV